MATPPPVAPAPLPYTVETLPLTKIHVDAAIQPRIDLSLSVVADYATLYAEADDTDPLPPLDVFRIGKTYYVTDGFHRLAAAKEAQRTTLVCHVYTGTQAEAMRHAAYANLRRGLAYSRHDRERILERLLQDPEERQRSNRDLAQVLGLSHVTVGRARQRLAHIATLTQELAAQPTAAPTPAAQRHEQLAAFLAVPVEPVALLAKHRQVDEAAVIRDIARTMADRGLSAQEATQQEAAYLVSRAERQAWEDAGKRPRPRETAAERATRQADAKRDNGYYSLQHFLMMFEELTPSTPTPEEQEVGIEPYNPDYTPAELIAAAESYIVAKNYPWARDEIVQKLQQASHVLDAFKAACLAQGWTVPF